MLKAVEKFDDVLIGGTSDPASERRSRMIDSRSEAETPAVMILSAANFGILVILGV